MEGILLPKRKGMYKGRKPALTSDASEGLKGRVSKGDKKAILHRISVLAVRLYISI